MSDYFRDTTVATSYVRCSYNLLRRWGETECLANELPGSPMTSHGYAGAVESRFASGQLLSVGRATVPRKSEPRFSAKSSRIPTNRKLYPAAKTLMRSRPQTICDRPNERVPALLKRSDRICFTIFRSSYARTRRFATKGGGPAIWERFVKYKFCFLMQSVPVLTGLKIYLAARRDRLF